MKTTILMLIPILLVAGCIGQQTVAPGSSAAKLGTLSLERLGFSNDSFIDNQSKSYRISVENTFNTTLAYRLDFVPEDGSFLTITHDGDQIFSLVFDEINPQEKTVAKVINITAHSSVAKAETTLSLRLYGGLNGVETLVEERNLTITITKK